MQTAVVRITGWGPGIDNSTDRIVKPISPAKQLKLDARRKDAALWALPQRYPERSPFMAFLSDFRSGLIPLLLQAGGVTAINLLNRERVVWQAERCMGQHDTG